MTKSNIATRAESEMLKSARSRPEPQLTLEPGGNLQYQVNYDMQRMRERRIAFIDNRLAMASEQLQRDHKRPMTRSQ